MKSIGRENSEIIQTNGDWTTHWMINESLNKWEGKLKNFTNQMKVENTPYLWDTARIVLREVYSRKCLHHTEISNK